VHQFVSQSESLVILMLIPLLLSLVIIIIRQIFTKCALSPVMAEYEALRFRRNLVPFLFYHLSSFGDFWTDMIN